MNGDNESLDRALELVRDDVPSAAQAAAAGERAGKALGLRLDTAQQPQPIADYDALVADYVAGRLSTPERQLFEAELRASVPLRRRVEAARAVGRPPSAQRRAASRGYGVWAWAAAATLLAAVAALLIVPLTGVTIDQARLAQLKAVNGVLYRVADGGLVPVAAGAWIDGGERLRTARNATAVLALDDGTEVEVGERSQLTFSRQRRGSRIRVDRGRIIVQAAEQADVLHVATDELLVAVTGTIFAVDHGTQGSRVGVVEGEVEVRRGREQTRLGAGELYASRTSAGASLEKAVGWSRHADRYVAMLREYAHLKRSGDALLRSSLRFSTRLLDLSPANTSAYLAVPNAPAMIVESVEIVRRLRTRVGAGAAIPATTGAFEQMLPWLRSVSEHLGPETALAFGFAREDEQPAPLLISAVKPNAGAQLRAILLERPPATAEPPFVLIDAPAAAEAGQLSVWLREDLLAASTSPPLLRELEAHLGGAANAFAESQLYARLVDLYADGAQYLGGIEAPGGDVETVVGGWQTDQDRSSLEATVDLAAGAAGPASWLDHPAPMATLDFFSAEAAFATAAVVRDVRDCFDAVLALPAVQALQTRGGLDFLDDFETAFGGEFAFGIDGPPLPTPSWLAIVEVYDGAMFHQGVRTLTERVNEVAALRGENLQVRWIHDDRGADSLYRIESARNEALSNVYYTIFNGYLIAAPNVALIERAKRTYQSGAGLTSAAKFRELLPAGPRINLSALAFSRHTDELLALLPSDGYEEERRTIDELRELLGPVLAGVYAERDAIKVVVNSAGEVSLPELAILTSLALGDGEGRPAVDGT